MDDSTVSTADIARLAGVGRAAVSNWRRRHADFPQPVGGTPSSPMFGLTDVQSWLRAQGKLDDVPAEEMLWQQVRSDATDDLRLAEVVVRVGEALLGRRAATDPASAAAIGLADGSGVPAVFEFLLGRYLEINARRVTVTPPELADLMVTLAGEFTSALDPACGTGGLLLAARAKGDARLYGQELDTSTARLAELRMALHPGPSTVRPGDSLRGDAFPGTEVDVVLCDPPFHERSWGHEELAADPRWTYGLPPRMEPELAWAQHALSHLAPGGLAIMLMPPVVAARRSGRRIRAQLLRNGALRAVIAYSATHHVWVLRRPDGSTGSVLVIESASPAAIEATWHAHRADPTHDEPGVSRAVPVIDLLDEEVDLTPGRHLSAARAGRTGERFLQTRDRLSVSLAKLDGLMPKVAVAADPPEPPNVSIAELTRIGALEIQQAPTRGDAGDDGTVGRPLLTIEDVIHGRSASARVSADDVRWIVTRAGDVVVAAVARRFAARVLDGEGTLLGPQLTLLRVNPEALDPYFLAGVLRSSSNAWSATAQSTGSGRADVRRVRVPQLDLDGQRKYGDAFRRMEEFQMALRSSWALGEELRQLLSDGVTEGVVRPSESDA